MTDFQALARSAAVEAHGEKSVGNFVQKIEEQDAGVFTYLFESNLKGYPDWRISVTLFQDHKVATVSEVLVVPGPNSLTAPAWVPWSERLADYKALQAALEAEAAAAAEASDDEDDDEDETVDAGYQDQDEVGGSTDENSEDDAELDSAVETESELALSDVPVTVDSQDDANETGGKGKGLFKWKTLRGGKKRK